MNIISKEKFQLYIIIFNNIERKLIGTLHILKQSGKHERFD